MCCDSPHIQQAPCDHGQQGKAAHLQSVWLPDHCQGSHAKSHEDQAPPSQGSTMSLLWQEVCHTWSIVWPPHTHTRAQKSDLQLLSICHQQPLKAEGAWESEAYSCWTETIPVWLLPVPVCLFPLCQTAHPAQAPGYGPGQLHQAGGTSSCAHPATTGCSLPAGWTGAACLCHACPTRSNDL